MPPRKPMSMLKAKYVTVEGQSGGLTEENDAYGNRPVPVFSS